MAVPYADSSAETCEECGAPWPSGALRCLGGCHAYIPAEDGMECLNCIRACEGLEPLRLEDVPADVPY
jgi:dissimilatory sulfite reductase (desulfoviridin) alpha/beta subunit